MTKFEYKSVLNIQKLVDDDRGMEVYENVIDRVLKSLSDEFELKYKNKSLKIIMPYGGIYNTKIDSYYIDCLYCILYTTNNMECSYFDSSTILLLDNE